MAIARVAGVTGGLNASGVTTSAIDTTGATLLTMLVVYYANGTGLTISDSKSNTWTATTERKVAGDTTLRLYYCDNPTVGTGHTFTASGTSVYAGVVAESWSGSANPASDQENGATGSGTSLAPGSITPSQDNCLVLAASGYGASSSGEAVTSPFSTPTKINFSSGFFYGAATAYDIQTTATARNPTWSGGSAARAAGIYSFKATGAAAGQPITRRFGGVDNANFRCGSEGVKMWRVQPRPSGLIVPDRSLVLPQPEMRLAN